MILDFTLFQAGSGHPLHDRCRHLSHYSFYARFYNTKLAIDVYLPLNTAGDGTRLSTEHSSATAEMCCLKALISCIPTARHSISGHLSEHACSEGAGLSD